MRKQSTAIKFLIAACCLCFTLMIHSSAYAASEPELDATDTVSATLEKFQGKTVTLKLASGEEIGGTVTAIGKNGVHLSQVTGKELFDAVIRLDRINAVVYRAPAKS